MLGSAEDALLGWPCAALQPWPCAPSCAVLLRCSGAGYGVRCRVQGGVEAVVAMTASLIGGTFIWFSRFRVACAALRVGGAGVSLGEECVSRVGLGGAAAW